MAVHFLYLLEEKGAGAPSAADAYGLYLPDLLSRQVHIDIAFLGRLFHLVGGLRVLQHILVIIGITFQKRQ